MKRAVSLVALGAVAGALAIPAAFADTDPLAAVKADIAKLTTDATARHDLVVADAQKLGADAEAAIGTPRKTALATIKADRAKLKSDREAATATVKADRAQLKTDVAAVHAAKTGKGQMKALLQPLRTLLQQQRTEIKSALQAAHDAVKALRASYQH